jgi:hypothetical protein
MISSRMAREPALLAVLSVLMIFLFPAMQGPYSAVHGPATALQAARAAVRVKVAIVQAAGPNSENGRISAPTILTSMSISNSELLAVIPEQLTAVQRC